MTSPLFTQKHYEHVISEMRRMRVQIDGVSSGKHLDEVAEVLCRIFQRDNPKFKPSKFVDDVRRVECCLCGGPIPARGNWTGGCNAQPVADGRCCYECEAARVLPARLSLMYSKT